MKLTAECVFLAVPVLDAIISEKRPLTVKGAYRIARMFQKLVPEFRLLEQRRDALIEGYGYMVAPAEGGDPVPAVPDDKVAEFHANWLATVKDEIEVEIEPLPLSALGPAGAESPVDAREMLALGDLLIDDDPPLAKAA